MEGSKLSERLTSAGLEAYISSIATHLAALQSLPHTKDQLAFLKERCGVHTLGQRHRIVALLGASTERSDALAMDVSEPSSTSSKEAHMPLHVARLVLPCEKVSESRLALQGYPARPDSSSSAVGERLRLDTSFPGLHRVHEEPPVFLCDGFLSSSECDAMVRCADPLLKQSLTHSGKSRTRTSKSCHLRKQLGPCPALLARISALLLGKPISHLEIPQVARYDEGQYYEPHFDATDETVESSLAGAGREFLESGGQRVGTVLIYLNDVPAGGHTRFNRLGIEISPRKGAALIFFPAFLDGGLDPLSMHEARPAVDRKYVCQVWVRQRELGAQAEAEYVGMGHRLLDALYGAQSASSEARGRGTNSVHSSEAAE